MKPLHLRRRKRKLFDFCCQMLSWFASRPTKRRRPYVFRFGQQLEPRLLLTGNPVANDDAFTVPYDSSGQINAPGVLANDTDPNHSQLMAHLVSGPSHTTWFQLNPDGSASFMFQSGFLGNDSFTYYDTNSMYMTSNTATVTLSVQYNVQAATDLTKQVPIGALDTSVQILGASSGTPATAQNLSLAYDSVAGQPDAVIQGMFQFNTNAPIPDTPTGTLTFNGVAQPATYVNLSGMNGTAHTFDLSYQLDTSALPTGRYPYTLVLNSPNMSAPATLSGAVNVVNDSAGPVGKGWDIPGLYHLYQNNVTGVPDGVLLTTGAQGWYFTQGAGNSYTSPNGPYAFDTLTSVTGGGWQLVDKFGTTSNFDSTGDLISRVARTGEATTYDWTSGLLTSIVDQFGRAVGLGYTTAQLSSITDYAGHVWSLAHVGANLTSVTEPDPGSGAPVWQYAYSGAYLSTVTDPDNQSGYTLDSHHRLSGVSLPGGGSTSDTSEQSLAYGGPTQAGAPNIMPSSSVMTTSTDAMSNSSATQTDAFGDPLYYQDPYGNITTWQRDANGLVTTLTEPPPVTGAAAPVTNYSYDTLGNETSATGAHPSYGTYVFNSFSEWTTFADSQNHVWTQVFDTHGNLDSTTDTLNNTVSYTNDSLGYPLTMTQPAPNNAMGTVTTTYTRDAYERLTKTTWPDATFRTFAYDTLDHQISVTDENNHTTTTNLDALGRVVSVINALNGTVATTYDKDGLDLTTQDEMGNVTTNVWNSRQELVQQTLPDPDGAGPLAAPVWGWTYDADGRKMTQTDPMNRVTSWTWDKLGRNTLETLPDPDGAGPLTSPVIIIGYDNLSRKVSEKDPLGDLTTWAYANTDVSELTSMTLPDPDASGPLTSPVWTYSFDTLGRQYQTDDPMGHLQTTSFDADGHTTSVLDNLGHGPSYAYGHGGELLTTTDALSNTTSDEYDSRYRLIQTTAADGGVTSITLDAAGNRTALVDPANNRTTWVVDALNRDTSETTALGTTTTSYDASSDVTSIQDADGRMRGFVFDNLHRLTAENWMSGSTIVAAMNYGYDADSELTSASDPNSAYVFGYDNDGDVLTVDNNGTPGVPDVLLTSVYDSMGDRTSLATTVAGVKDLMNSYSFDADQRLTMLQQQGQSGGNTVSPKEVDLAYNALGQFTTIADFNYLGGGPRMDMATGVYSYDTANRISGLTYTSNAGANQIDAFGWGYDVANNVTSFTTDSGTATYGNDVTNQLTSATYTGTNQPTNEAYSYDKNGNRTNTGYTTGADNLLTSDGTFNYQHDADGNQTVRTRISNVYATDYKTTYAWDYRNRLTDVEYFDNNGVLTKHVHYVYGVFDHLLATEVDTTGGGSYNVVEHYVLDVSPELPSAGVPGTALAQPLLQFDANGNETIRYLEALNRIFAEGAYVSPNSGDTTTWGLVDNLGSERYVVDNSGNVIDQIDYNSFGLVTYESNATVHHFAGYTGGHIDRNTGEVINYHRVYDPPDGRWLNQDSDGFSAGDANLYRYVANDATGATDSTGLFPGAPLTTTPPPFSSPPAGFVPSLMKPTIGFQATSGTLSFGSLWPPQTYGYGQPSSQATGSFSTLGPNTGMTSVTLTGPGVCNTCNQAGNPSVASGVLTASLNNYPPGVYIVTFYYSVVIFSSNPLGIGGSATVYGAGGANIPTLPGVPLNGQPMTQVATVTSNPGSNFVTSSNTVIVTVPPSGKPTNVAIVAPSLSGSGNGTVTCNGAISLGPVAPYNPAYILGLGGGF